MSDPMESFIAWIAVAVVLSLIVGFLIGAQAERRNWTGHSYKRVYANDRVYHVKRDE